jgi:hypothetical protein
MLGPSGTGKSVFLKTLIGLLVIMRSNLSDVVVTVVIAAVLVFGVGAIQAWLGS